MSTECGDGRNLEVLQHLGRKPPLVLWTDRAALYPGNLHLTVHAWGWQSDRQGIIELRDILSAWIETGELP